MEIELFLRLVDNEIEWLRYYASIESRKALNEKSDIYKDLKPQMYVKRFVELDIRCAPSTISCDFEISPGISIELLKQDSFPRTELKLTPLEAAIRIFPDKKMHFLNKLK